MANPSISLWGATYSAVPGVSLPTSGGGEATFKWVEGSQSISENGTYDVTALEEVVVNVSGGGTPAISVVDTQDSHGGTIRTITALNISDSTLTTADQLAQGVTAYNKNGVKLTGTGGGGSTLVTKTITLNGTYDPDDDNADGYSEVIVNVQGGASVSEIQGTYGTEVVVTSGNAPSATSHTIYFEFADETDETIIGYWNDTFISDAITATEPTTYDSKTVTLAQLDGVTWYSYTPPTPGQWETVWTGQANTIPEDPYPYFWISDMSTVYPVDGEVWRVTINNDEYVVTAYTDSGSNTVLIGNTLYFNGTDNGVQAPFCLYNAGWGAFMGNADLIPSTTYNLKFEKAVTGE